MNVVVFGANGRVGSKVVEYAKEYGHMVTAFVRKKNSISIPGITVEEGNSLDFFAVRKAVKNADVVISALGVKNFGEAISLMSESIKNIALAMYSGEVKRILAVGGAGVLQENETTLRIQMADFPSNFKNVSLDHLRVLRILEGSHFNWTLVCPPFMPSEERTGKYRATANYHPEHGLRISAEDVADFLVKEMVENKFMKQRVGIAY